LAGIKNLQEISPFRSWDLLVSELLSDRKPPQALSFDSVNVLSEHEGGVTTDACKYHTRLVDVGTSQAKIHRFYNQ
jgi:hypothetical protein